MVEMIIATIEIPLEKILWGGRPPPAPGAGSR